MKLSIFREPFLQFLVLGGIIFGLYAGFADEQTIETALPVVVDRAFVQTIVEAWKERHHREPSDAELRNEIGNWVREQVLYREGKARGLDENDIIIVRHVAQKMDFLTAELAGMKGITESELKVYFQAHKNDYAPAPKISFEHVFFSKSRNGAAADLTAHVLSEDLKKGTLTWPEALSRGDPSLLIQKVVLLDKEQVETKFGQSFTRRLFELKAPDQAEVLESEFGFHVVRISEPSTSSAADFESVKEKVQSDLERERRGEAEARFYQELRKRIPVVIEGVDVPGLRASDL